MGMGKNKGKKKDNILGRAKESEYDGGLPSMELLCLKVSFL
jgi:hypothetical protein